MTVSELDIHRAANVVLKQRGASAAQYASLRADRLLEKGDVEGASVWRRLVIAIDKLSEEPAAGAPVN